MTEGEPKTDPNEFTFDPFSGVGIKPLSVNTESFIEAIPLPEGAVYGKEMPNDSPEFIAFLKQRQESRQRKEQSEKFWKPIQEQLSHLAEMRRPNPDNDKRLWKTSA